MGLVDFVGFGSFIALQAAWSRYLVRLVLVVDAGEPTDNTVYAREAWLLMPLTDPTLRTNHTLQLAYQKAHRTIRGFNLKCWKCRQTLYWSVFTRVFGVFRLCLHVSPSSLHCGP